MYLLGGAPGVGAAARGRLQAKLPRLRVLGVDDALIDVDGPPEAYADVVARIKESGARLVFVALGAPKQELWIDSVREALRPAVLLGVGASLDFVAGRLARAPAWMSNAGLEWAFRLAKEPRRLWRRYLVRDPAFFLIVGRGLLTRALVRDAVKASGVAGRRPRRPAAATASRSRGDGSGAPETPLSSS